MGEAMDWTMMQENATEPETLLFRMKGP